MGIRLLSRLLPLDRAIASNNRALPIRWGSFFSQDNTMQTTTDLAHAVQSTTGLTFKLRPACPREWAGEWPTDRSGDILISEAPGSADGSIFAYWLGDKTLTCDGVLPAIEAHMDDHDVVDVRVIFAFPDDAHLSLKVDLAELKKRSSTTGLLAVREGIRVRIKTNQARIGGDKYPDREGIVQSNNCVATDYWYVRLTATARAPERVELFSVDALDVLTTTEELATLPPISGKQFADQLDKVESLLFAGASYVLLPHQVTGLRDGWAVNAAYPNGSHKQFGQQHPLTRSLALQVAAQDAMDWWLNRREAQAQVTFG